MMTKKISIFLSLVTVFYFLGCGPSGKTDEEMKTNSLNYFEEMQTSLKKELKMAMESGGPSHAVSVCRDISPSIESEISKKNGLTIRRVSDKNRNPDHQPDAFESSVLTRWQSEIKSGNKPQVVAEKDGENFRVVKPILIGDALCLKCHGSPSEIDAKTQAVLSEKYPNDRATGYSTGDLRGAFSAVWKLSK